MLFGLFLLSACSGGKTTFRNEADMQAYLNDPDNGFIVSDETADLLVEAKLTPAIAGDEDPQVTIQLRLTRKDGASVLNPGTVPQAEVSGRESYLSFEVLNDVYLEDGGKTTPALFSHYERNYGLKPGIDLFFRFKNIQPQSAVYLVYRDQLFGQGLIRLKFKKALFTPCHV